MVCQYVIGTHGLTYGQQYGKDYDQYNTEQCSVTCI